MTRPLGRIVIAGGGSAGWMVAALLARYLRASPTQVTLVESEEIGTIGVGEASLPLLCAFNQLIGLDERTFVTQTRGTFKLGIRFVDWMKPGHAYFHPFGSYGQNFDVCDFHHYWLRTRQPCDVESLGDFNLNTVLMRANRFGMRRAQPASPLSSVAHAYHFDATLYADCLRKHAQANGVTRIEGKIREVRQTPETGFVTGLALESGELIEGDLFVDCTGFRALLIEKTLKAGFVDWTGLLPCDRAVAVASPRLSELTPYTQATARGAGWQWRIPLQHRTGNGYVYSSQFLSDEEATAGLLENINGAALSDPRLIKFQTGRRAKAWSHNVIAVGLSAGFLEPLESTSIHLIQKGAQKLLQCLPDMTFAPELRDEFNRQTAWEYEDVRDFLVLHYKLTLREDTAFWKYNRHNEVSDSLRERVQLFSATGRLFVGERELFKSASWLAVMLGQGIEPRYYDPMADALPRSDLLRTLDQIRHSIAICARQQAWHDDFVERFTLPESH